MKVPASRDEAGQVAGLEAITFGLLTFVVAVLLAANAWAVVDAKMTMATAAREAVRGHGRDPDRLELRPIEAGFTRCQVVRFEASYRVPAITLPFVGGGGTGFTAAARHAEIVDPYRDGLPSATARCDRG